MTFCCELCKNCWIDWFVIWDVYLDGQNKHKFNCIRQCAIMGGHIGATWRIQFNRPSLWRVAIQITPQHSSNKTEHTNNIEAFMTPKWLFVCSEVQMTCIWSSWCHCHPIISYFIKIHIGLTFLVPAYPGCPEKKAAKQFSACGSWWVKHIKCCWRRLTTIICRNMCELTWKFK